MPHFFITSKNLNDIYIITPDDINFNHLSKSLRIKVGETILLMDEKQFQHEGIVEKVTPKLIEIKIIKSYKSHRYLDFKLYLAQSPLRNDAQSFIVEKATELGVEGIYPIYTDNCVLKKSVIEQKIPKWQKVMYEASKQCERAYVPNYFELSRMEELSVDKQFDRILAFTERRAKYKLKKYLKERPILTNEKILVIIGPEGGFSDREFNFFEENNIITLSLGNLILKAETAVIAALGNIVL